MESARKPLLPASVTVGEIIAGKYRVERVLGSGGMGVVVAASHVGLKQAVAIKFLLPRADGEPALAMRLLREARAAAALKGEHVARVFDVDVLDNGSPYIVMEHLEGQTLASLIEARGALPPAEAVDWALQACEALAEAHALGIVHRDLKPANLFVARSPGGRQTLRVLDFGISKALESERNDSTYTNTDSHALMGSPPYVSPEQLVSPREVDARTDIWSLGVVVYECLTARRPFRGETVAQLWDSILREPPAPLGTASRPVAPGLERVVLRCLEKKLSARYTDVRELARALAPFGTERARASLEVVEGLAVPPAKRKEERQALLKPTDETLAEADAPLTDEPMTRSSTGVAVRPSYERRILPAVALLALGLVGAYVFRGGSSVPAEAQPSATNAAHVAVPQSAAPANGSLSERALDATEAPAASASANPVAVLKTRPAQRAAGSRRAVTDDKAKVPVAADVRPTEAERTAPPSSSAPAPQREPDLSDEAVYSDRE